MRLLLFTGNYPPEIGPNARIMGEVAAGLAARGHEVRVVTALPNHPFGVIQPGWEGSRVEDGVEVTRTWLPAGRGAFRRLLSACTWGLTGLAAAVRGPRPDVVLGISTPYPAAMFGVLAARLLATPHVLYVQDLYPETLEALGFLRSPWLRALAGGVARVERGGSAAILAIGREFADRMGGGTEVLPNWVDVERFARPPGRVDFRLRWGLQPGEVAVVFAGTVGAAQGLDTLVEAARRLPWLRFVIVGEGVQRARLQALAPSNVSFHAPVAFAEMPDLLAAADISVISLRDEPVWDLTLPCKTCELMASGRAIACSAGRAVRVLVEEAGAGLCAPPGDAEALAAVLQRLAGSPELRTEMGERGRRYAEGHFRREVALDRLEALLARTSAGWWAGRSRRRRR